MNASERPAAPVFANTRSDRVKAVRTLAGRSARSRPAGRLVAEGPQAVAEAADAGAILDLWITPDQHARHADLAETVVRADGYVHVATPEVLKAMSPAAQGVLAIADWPEPTLADIVDIAETPGAAADPRAPEAAGRADHVAGGAAACSLTPAGGGAAAWGPHASLVAVVEECRDPGNAGTVIRAADAAGAAGVVFTTASVDVRGTKAVRASAGSLFHLPVVQGLAIGEVLAALKIAGLTILAADGAGEHSLDALLRAAHAPTHPAHAPTHPAHAPTRPTRGEPLTGTLAGSRDRGPGEAPPTRPPDLRAPTAWVFGNEAHGLSAEARRAADAIVRIPIYGRAESYNLAMAATLCLHASATARAPTRPRVTAGE